MEIVTSLMAASIELTAWPALAQHLDRWENLRAGAGLLHPFFSPHWFDAVHQALGNVEVLIFRHAGEIRGFLPFQRTGWRTAGPAGGHFADYQGVVGANLPCLAPSVILSTARLESFDLDHGVPTAMAWDVSGWLKSDSPIISLADGFSALTEHWSQRGSAWRTLARKERKLIREKGSWRFTSHLPDPPLLDLLITWKRTQYRSTGVRDVLANPRQRKLLHYLLHPSKRHQGWEVRLSVLQCHDQPIALHLGLWENGIWHYWFPAYDPAWAPYSPGLLLLREMVREACNSGGDIFDFGKGQSRYKTEWSNRAVPLVEGCLTVPGCVAARRLLVAWLRNTARKAGATRLKSAWQHLRSNVRS